jgi:hypothetical protein
VFHLFPHRSAKAGVAGYASLISPAALPRAQRAARGITARPWGILRKYPHAFFGPGGHVYERTSRARLPIKKLWGPAIPKEMVKDEAEATFYRVSAELLGPAVEKWLLRQTDGGVSGS